MNIKKILAGLSLTVASAVASAAPWTQTIDFNPDIYIGPAHTWTHDLTTVGFNPGSDLITNFTLTVNILDDKSDKGLATAEWAFVDLPGIVADAVWTSPIGSNSTGTSLLGAFSLNANGLLSVTVSATNAFLVFPSDFMLASSTLTANGYDAPSSNVPEPGALALVGLGLVGVALRRRQQRAA
jgi:PEP-CTERM motif